MVEFSDAKGQHLQAEAKKTRADKKRDLKESIGSLDRRIQKALGSGDTDTAKDLRSRQKKVVKKLGYKEAVDAMKAAGSTKIAKTGEGNPVMSGAGKDVFNETMDKYFIDPTRNLQNTNPKAYGKMYPGANFLQNAIPTLIKKGASAINPALGILGLNIGNKNKNIPYTNPETQGLPGAEFPLGYAEALGTPEAYNLGNGINNILANSVDGTAPININATAAGLNLPEGYQVMNANSLNDGLQFLVDQGAMDPVEGSGDIDLGNVFGKAQDGVGIFNNYNLGEYLPADGIFSKFNNLKEGFEKLNDNQGFDFNIGNKELKYNKPLGKGNLQFSLDPNQAGIMYSLGMGS